MILLTYWPNITSIFTGIKSIKQESIKTMDLHGRVVYQQFITMVILENVILQQVQDNDPDQKLFADL